MTKFQKQSLVWFVVYVVVLGAVIMGTSSCSGSRVGCAQHSGYMGYR